MAALAGARRTESAYGRYLQSIHASDVMVNIPSTNTALIATVEHLPGARSSTAFAGLDANPVVRGRGRRLLPHQLGREQRGWCVLPPGHADRAVRAAAPSGLHQRDRPDTWHSQAFRSGCGRHRPLPALRRELVQPGGTGLGRFSGHWDRRGPRRSSTSSISKKAPFCPGRPHLGSGERSPTHGWGFDCTGEVQACRRSKPPWRRLATKVGHGYAFNVRRLDTVHRQVQDAIRPQAVALAVFGGLAALALLILVSQSVAQWLQRSAESLSSLRALGLTRRGAALTYALGPALAVVAGVVLAMAGSVTLSPLAPLEPVRQLIPCMARSSNPFLVGGALVLGVALLGVLAWMAWQGAWPRLDTRMPSPSRVAQAADAAGLPRWSPWASGSPWSLRRAAASERCGPTWSGL